ncbi:Chromosome segregation protein smc [Pleurostoma richardsiae]|uniref:Chromosome segregation protein smc n=1 Tax=Pleurostoma richardsiae TaxID=41990 RepID=A0AA38RCW8_9PEZI|nr:Chromosome segregation protein smc [Pleurostoma richardsiae]
MNSRNAANGATLYHEVKQQALSTSHLGPHGTPDMPRRMASTIRHVSSFDEDRRVSEDSTSESSPSIRGTHPSSAFSSSVNSNASALSAASDTQLPLQNGTDRSAGSRLKLNRSRPALDPQPPILDVPQRTVSPGIGLRSPLGAGSVAIPLRDSSLGSTGRPAHTNSNVPSHTTAGSGQNHSAEASAADPSWDSTIGKAGLGKTGRVINRLVSENESLKRDIQIERLKAEEARQAARLLEDKMERIISDYESRLLEANVTKTLLARKERQVESLQAAVELERERTREALKREQTWRHQMEQTRDDSKRQVEEATNLAALMEGRYNAISSHWKDQGEEVKRAMTRMGKEVGELLEERRKDDEKITVLKDLCDQQDGNIRELRQQNEDIARQFQAYKNEQENALHNIKTKAAEREAQQERTLAESSEVLNKLRWALNVKENIEWAQ